MINNDAIFGLDVHLNPILHIAALVRMRTHDETRDYLQKRTTEGKTTREIRRPAQALPHPQDLQATDQDKRPRRPSSTNIEASLRQEPGPDAEEQLNDDPRKQAKHP